MTPVNLIRFKHAQEGPGGFDVALRELRTGAKRSHWIWYIFPQLDGLGRSATAAHFALGGVEEATAYLRDPVLRQRLLEASGAVRAQLQRNPAPALASLMGTDTDALKLVSSMTLFHEVAARIGDRDVETMTASVLAGARMQGYPPCRFTLEHL